jgi:Reverse transcriptase (RNA-dependent DNA polymerase)/Endonuclease-reverse transcriptase
MFWNSRGLRRHLISGALESLVNPTLNPHPPSIVVLAETHWSAVLPYHRTSTTQLPNIPHYSWAHRHHTHRSGGLVILYHNSIACIPMSILDQQCNPINAVDPASASAVMWHTIRFPNTPPFLLGAGYIAPDDHNGPAAARAMGQAITNALAMSLPVVLVGDFNLIHPNWMDFTGHGSPTVAANAFASYLTSAALTVLNAVLIPDVITRPAPPGSRGKGSIIDLAITNAPHLILAMDSSHYDSLESDHVPLTMTMDLRPQQPPHPSNTLPRQQWSVHRNTEHWQSALPLAMAAALNPWPLTDLTHPIPSDPQVAANACQKTVDEAYTAFEAILLSTCEEVVGKHFSSDKTKNWFSYPGVKPAYAHMKATRKIWQHSRTPNLIKQRAAQDGMTEWKVIVKRAKSDSWAALCSSIQEHPTSPLRWTAFKRSRGRVISPLGSFPSAQGTPPANITESLSNLCSSFVTSSVPPPLPANSTELDLEQRYLLPRLPHSLLYQASALSPHASDGWTFTTAEVQDQCTHQHTTSAPGCDTILPLILKHAGQTTYKALSELYNYSWRHGVLPQQWTEANVLALWKGKGAKSDPSSFRPISMTSIIIRTFEHLIHRPLVTLLESASFFHPLQFGFRKNHSTLDAINYFQSNTRAMFPTSHQMPCPTLFLDLEKAFDRVWHPKLMQCIEQAGITGRAWSWIYAFLTRRRIRTIDRNHHSTWQSLHYGVPQGAVLSPLLFNIFINPIARRIATGCPRLNLQLYADDMVAQPRAPPIVNGVRQHAGAIRQVVDKLFNVVLVNLFRLLNNWCNETRMRFGERKTQWVVFDKTQGSFSTKDYTRYSQYRLCGFSPQVVEEYNYLGVTHHFRFKWHTQAKEAVQRIRQDSYILSRLIHPPSAPHFPAIRMMCLGYIRPRCMYAWAFWSAKPAQIRAMQAAFIRPMQRSLGLHSSSHHLGMLVEAHCPSFEALRTQAAARFLLHSEALLLSHPLHPTSQTLILDRRAASVGHCRAHVKSRITVNISAVQTAIPHLINKVLAHLPTLAPFHPLMKRYFPSHLRAADGPALPAAALPVPLPTTLTIDEVNSLTMVDTHREWRAEPANDLSQSSTAPLLTIKTSPVLSLYLKMEYNPIAGVRARIRANRTHTQFRRYKLRQVQDPSCTFAACRISSPHYLDTIDHILLFCPRHQTARNTLITALAPLSHGSRPLTVALISGEVATQAKLNKAQQVRSLHLLQLTNTFLTQVNQDREADPHIRPFVFVPGADALDPY